jgi:hypothetical protein
LRSLASEGHPQRSQQEHFASVMAQNTSELLQTAALMKNEAFSEEREVRFISPLIRL